MAYYKYNQKVADKIVLVTKKTMDIDDSQCDLQQVDIDRLPIEQK